MTSVEISRSLFQCPVLRSPGRLQEQGDDGAPEFGVVLKLLQIDFVFPSSPDSHLDEAYEREQGDCEQREDTGQRQHPYRTSSITKE